MREGVGWHTCPRAPLPPSLENTINSRLPLLSFHNVYGCCRHHITRAVCDAPHIKREPVPSSAIYFCGKSVNVIFLDSPGNNAGLPVAGKVNANFSTSAKRHAPG